MGCSSSGFNDDWFENAEIERLAAWVHSNPDAIDTPNNDGFTAMHTACYFHQPEMLTLLYQAGARIDIATKKRYAPYGSDIIDVGRMGNTPLHVASCRGSHKCVALLIQWGAKVKRNKDKQLALDLAADAVVIDMLERHRDAHREGLRQEAITQRQSAIQKKQDKQDRLREEEREWEQNRAAKKRAKELLHMEQAQHTEQLQRQRTTLSQQRTQRGEI